MRPSSASSEALRRSVPSSGSWLGEKVRDFQTPTADPGSCRQHDDWQSANRSWWESHPMRYDWKRALAGTPGELSWFDEIDRRFFGATVLPNASRQFESLLPNAALAGKSVLEVGIGMGSHSRILAQGARQFVGVDLSRPAVTATKRRLQLTGLERASVLQMDVEKLAFPDGAFDLVWSWGVIHHSASTRRALEEIRRVLKTDGCALVMVYHRAFVPWWIYNGLIRGISCGGLFRNRTIHRVVQASTDGALARYYTAGEWRREISGLFQAESIEVYGNRGEVLPLPAGVLKDKLTRCIPEPLLRFWLTTCGQGTLLFSRLRPLAANKRQG